LATNASCSWGVIVSKQWGEFGPKPMVKRMEFTMPGSFSPEDPFNLLTEDGHGGVTVILWCDKAIPVGCDAELLRQQADLLRQFADHLDSGAGVQS